MKYDPQLHHRRSIRIQGYDYSQSGAYFATIVVHERECLFGEISNGGMILSKYGQIVQDAWFDLPNHYSYVDLGAFCIMPNHVHGIIFLDEPDVEAGHLGAGLRPAPTARYIRHPLSEIIRAFKSFSARSINATRDTQGAPVWQRNYYEHIVRNEEELNRTHLYIESNPGNWADDEEYPG